jgi:predicted membrane protein
MQAQISSSSLKSISVLCALAQRHAIISRRRFWPRDLGYNRRVRIRRFLPALVIASAVLLLLWKLAFTNLILARGDTFFYIYPYWEHRARELLAGQLPLWNPYLFMGAPFLANPQAGVLYPLNWPLAPFAAPTAVKIAIITHTLIAAAGVFKLAQRALNLTSAAATLAALLFALGGHLTGKMEQVNQLQALAWMPWLLLAAHRQVTGSSARERTRAGLVLAGLLALQLLAGHTQTTFITLLAAALWALSTALGAIRNPSDRSTALRRLLPLLAFTIMGALIAGAQLLPAIELARKSLRSTGLPLNDALSFSLHPLLLGRALLPGLSRPLFSEFIGYVGVAGLLLALAGLAALMRGIERARALAATVLAGCGLFLALGAYNPLYWPLARFVPGFNLFRAPARYLALWALGAALLAGLGFERIPTLSRHARRRLALVFSTGTVTLAFLAFAGTGTTPAGETGPLPAPATADIAAWALALSFSLAALLQPTRTRIALAAVLALELGMASSQLPLNNLTTSDAYASVRAPMTQLLLHREDQPVPGRMFSMSALRFDPGDLSDMRTRLRMVLPEAAVTTAVDAAKVKEVLSPNLPLAWRVPAVDGYGGGLLPLRAYAQFARQFTPDNTLPEDGRLRERVSDTPANWLLNITNTRWLITDKVEDIWRDDVFYDLQFQIALPREATTTMVVKPTFQATAVGLVYSAPPTGSAPLGQLQLTLADGSSRTVSIPAALPVGGGRVPLGEPMDLTAVTLQSAITGMQLRGAAVIDARTGAFITLTLDPYRMAHSGDVKIYENLNVFPRAYLVHALPLTADTRPIGRTMLRAHTPNRIVIETESDATATLVLADAHYPGWHATVDRKQAVISPANGFFRSVVVQAGSHEVIFDYQPMSWRWGLWISAVALVLWTWAWQLTRRRARPSN